MADEPIETVAVRLLADARPLLETTDEAIESVTESVDGMGSAVEDSINKTLEEGGQIVADFADKFTISIKKAMEILKKTGDLDVFLKSFTEGELLQAADVIRGQIVDPMSEATVAADGFGEKINVQVADLLSALEQTDVIDEFLGKFSQAELEAVAQSIDQNITDPVEVAARTFVELAQISGTTVSEMMSQFEGTEKVAVFGGEESLRAIIDMGTAIESDLQIPIENARRAIVEFADSIGLSVESVIQSFGGEGAIDEFLSKFSSAELTEMAQNIDAGLVSPVIAATEAADQFGNVYSGAFEEAGFQTSVAVEKLQEFISESETGLPTIQNVLRTFAEDTEISLEQAAASLSNMAVSGMKSKEELLAVVDSMRPLIPISVQAAEAASALREQLEFIGDDLEEKLQKEITEFFETIDEGTKITREHVKQLISFNDRISKSAAALELGRPLIQGMTDDLKAMGASLPSAIEIKKMEEMIIKIDSQADSVEEAKKQMADYINGIKEATGDSADLGEETDILSGFFRTFGGEAGGLAGHLFHVATKAGLILIAFTAIKKVIDIIQEAAENAIEFSATIGSLSAALALQSAATGEASIGLSEMIGISEELAVKFALSSDEILEAAKTLLLMNQQSKLTNEQMLVLIGRGSAMADIFEERVEGTLVNLMNFIATGLRSGLEDFGLRLDQVAVKAKAMDLGFSNNLKTLSDTELAFIRYNLIMEQTALFEDAAAASIDTLSDRISIVTERLDNASETLGNIFAPAIVAVKEQWADVVEGFTSGVQLLVVLVLKSASEVIASFMTMAATLIFFVEGVKNKAIPTLKELDEFVSRTFNEAKTQLFQAGVDKMLGSLNEMEQGFGDLAGAVEEAGDAIQSITDDMVDSFMDAADRFDAGMARIEQRFIDTMDDITARFARRRADVEIDLARDLRGIDADAAQRRIDSIQDFQIKEIRMREDHQLDLRRLEEGFIFDLEDAVRNRDARAVLNLQRRFNLEKKRKTEDFNLNTKRLKENHKEELLEIDKQRALKRAARLLAHSEELLDLEEQERLRREQEQLQRDRAERDLIDDIRLRLDLLTEGAKGELAIEAAKLKALMTALNLAYGENSYYERMYERAVEVAELAAARIAAANGRIFTGQRGGRPYLGGRLLEEESRQRGGSVLATSPTQILIGEGRPEIAEITPLSQATGAPSAGFRGGIAGGRGEPIMIELEVDASEMLFIKVSDQTMSDIAEVVVTLNQRGGGGMRGG